MNLTRCLISFVAAALPAVSVGSPNLGPFQTSLEAKYEGGSRLNMAVCKHVLCNVSVVVNGHILRVANKELASVIDPDLSQAHFYLGGTQRLTAIIIVVPMPDWDFVHPGVDKTARIRFIPWKFSRVVIETRKTPRDQL